jgi:hypothetical protein
MKNFTILIVSIFSFAYFSCKKNNAPDNTTTSFSKVKTYTEDITVSGVHTVTSYNVNYDSADRITSLISTSNPGDKFVFHYNSGSSFILDIFNSNELFVRQIFFLNASLLVDSTVRYSNTHDTATEKYLYNGSNQLSRLKEYDYTTATGSVLWNTHNYSYDNNGNLTGDSDGNSVYNYEYTNMVNNLSIFFFDPTYYTRSHNLVQTTTYQFGGNTQIINHTYTFDSQNRVSTAKEVVAISGDVVIKSYTYF